MATRWAVATGNWSAVSTWDGGTTLPTSADDVYSNGFTVTIDQNVTVLSLQNGATTGVVAGGSFATSGTRTISANGTGFISAAVALLAPTASSTLTLNGNATSTGAGICLNLGQLGTYTITGNLICNGAGAALQTGSANTVNITGNVTSNSSGNGISSGGSGTITVTGNVTNTASGAAISSSNGNISITGNVTASGTTFAVSCTTTNGSPFIYGTITANTYVGMNLGGAAIKVSGPFISSATGYLPISGSALYKLTAIASNEFRFASATTGTSSLYSVDVLSGPSISDVRNGVTYSYAGTTKTGTLKVPATQYVAYGVAVDNTVGSYDPATDFWNKQTSVLTTAGSIGERLKNTATVDTVGAQIAANAL